MTRQFASIELARLYESQGYLEDALTMYRALDGEDEKSQKEIRAAVARLESARDANLAEAAEAVPSPEQKIAQTLAQVNESEPPETMALSEREERISSLLEKWIMLMVVRKRIKLFKAIRARL